MKPQPDPDLIASAKAMREDGMNWRQIGVELGVPASTLHQWLNPGKSESYRTRRYTQNNDYQTPPRPLIDTRDLSARLCGDPLPERSALAKKIKP